MNLSQWKGQEFGSCSVQKPDVFAIVTWCLSTKEFLVASLHWNLKELGSYTSEGMPQQQDR